MAKRSGSGRASEFAERGAGGIGVCVREKLLFVLEGGADSGNGDSARLAEVSMRRMGAGLWMVIEKYDRSKTYGRSQYRST